MKIAKKVSNQKQRLLMVAALLGWCAALLLYRTELSRNWMGVGLLWNLLLASVPLVWAAAFQSALESKRRVLAALCFALWLLFLPNAPYLLTDLIHLGPRPPVPLWFVLVVLLSCAGTGTLLGYLSLGTVHHVVERSFGTVWGWGIVVGSLGLCGFGIYVGRFLRWNSWDALTRPIALLRDIVARFVEAGPYPHPVPVTLLFGGGLLLGYLALRVIGGSPQTEPRSRV